MDIQTNYRKYSDRLYWSGSAYASVCGTRSRIPGLILPLPVDGSCCAANPGKFETVFDASNGAVANEKPPRHACA